MKNLPIRVKITIWFTAALVVIISITYLAILSVSRQVIQKTIRDSLIEAVSHNIDEIEYYKSIEEANNNGDLDYYVSYNGGILEIDDDFLDEVNGIFTALYDSNINFYYGENPIAKETMSYSLSDSVIQTVSVNSTLYYIFDKALTQPGLEGLWLRGIVSEKQGEGEISSISRFSLIALPILLVLSVTGGYLIAKKMLRPIQEISEAASHIEKGGDLKKRIEIGNGKDELHQLANSFNEMFKRLDESFETERRFTSDASHELRTPMAVIMAQCEFILEKDRSPEEYKKALTVINRQSKRMTVLINDMLDYTRMEMKADSYERQPLDLSQLVRSVCDDMALIRDKGIILSYDAGDSIQYCANRYLLTRMLGNLISNAYKYGKENGHILVLLERKNDEILLHVEDDGIGISSEDLPHIFDRFYRADNSRSGKGTGLGLSMVKQIASFHGADIEVESTPGKGSRFTIRFAFTEEKDSR